MKCRCFPFTLGALLALALSARAQQAPNCFLIDYAPRTAAVPPFVSQPRIAAPPTVTVTFDAADTLGTVSKYIFGDAVAVWVGPNQNNPALLSHMQRLAPTLIRFPGGSWSDIYFHNGLPADLPDSIPDGTNNGKLIPLGPRSGQMNSLTPAEYYAMRRQLGTQGLITINYGYARYGLGEKPVELAAHLAADWVRYDSGRTRFWEIGNENGGPWEAGWQIDTTRNRDGQPKIMSGALYGKHFHIFADSMRAAARETGAVIYIGGQILHYDGTNSWNIVDRTWNAGFFREAGDSPDFYVIHDYFDPGKFDTGLPTAVQSILTGTSNGFALVANFIRQDIAGKGAARRPVALTEYNMGSSYPTVETSFIKGVQAVILYNELAKYNFGLAARWLAVNTETDGMFYPGNATTGIPQWNPRPEYFYALYAQRFTGDHVVSASASDNKSVAAYASTFSSGHVALTIVNKSSTDMLVSLRPKNYRFGNRCYAYTLEGGTDNGSFSQYVYVNGAEPSFPEWGPLRVLDTLSANAYPADTTGVLLPLPLRSVAFLLLEPGNNTLTGVTQAALPLPGSFTLRQNYPNPFNPSTTISYTLPRAADVTLRVYDVIGREVAVLLHAVPQTAGQYEVVFNGGNLASGLYFYKLQAGRFTATKTMALTK